MSFFERRKSPRFAINKEIKLFLNEKEELVGKLDNISDNGCLIIFEHDSKINLKDKVRFSLNTNSSSMEFKGYVIRVEKFLGKTKIGVFFEEY